MENLPPLSVPPLLNRLKEAVTTLFEEEKISYRKIQSLGTLCRLVIYVEDIPLFTRGEEKVIPGPPWEKSFDSQGNPLPPLKGFLKKQGRGIEDVQKIKKGKGEYAGVVLKKEGKEVKEVLREKLPSLLLNLRPTPSMRWKGGEFLRPVKWILSLLGEEVIEFSVWGVSSSRFSRGHFYLSPQEVSIPRAERDIYLALLRDREVIADPEERREMIEKKTGELLQEEEEKVLIPHLEERNVWGVEHPCVCRGSFPERFLSLPEEVILASLVEHQNYIPIRKRGKVSSGFIVVGEGKEEYASSLVRGHERVVRARLWDAEFFWKEDLKIPLEERVPALRGLIFHEKGGSYWDKMKRMEKIAEFLSGELSLEEGKKEKLLRAVFLSKADLLTQMVQEFPSLQGIMGGRYLLEQGGDQEIAMALEDQYLPHSEWRKGLPRNEMGYLLGIIDRVDTLSLYASLDSLPTGSYDPYGLRRQAQGLILLLLGSDFSLSLKELLSFALSLHGAEDKLDSLWDFLLTRFRFYLRDKGFSYDILEAVLCRHSSDLKEIHERIKAFQGIRERGDFLQIITPYRRTANILEQAKRLYPEEEYSTPREELMDKEEEKLLWERVRTLREKVGEFYENKRYARLLEELISLKPLVDRYFDAVLVMEENPMRRKNHLSLLQELYSLFSPLADFTRFRGE